MNNEQLIDLECRDCKRCIPSGTWEPAWICRKSGMPVNAFGSACIDIKPRKK